MLRTIEIVEVEVGGGRERGNEEYKAQSDLGEPFQIYMYKLPESEHHAMRLPPNIK